MSDGIICAREHKSTSSYGSANLVVSDIATYLNYYVENARHFLIKDDADTALFPSAYPWDDMGEVCAMFGEIKFGTTLLRKAASSAACSTLDEVDRRRVANHMTHRPETAFKAYSAKARHSLVSNS